MGVFQFLLIALLAVNLEATSELGMCIGSSAAEQLLLRHAKSELQQPRLLQLELQSGVEPWFDPVVHVDSRNRVNFDHIKIQFVDGTMEVEVLNLTLKSVSNVYLLPLPFFLGKDAVHVKIQSPSALVRFKIQNLNLEIAECALSVSNMDVQLDNAYLLNKLINPLHRNFMPKSVIRDFVCRILENTLNKLQRRFALDVPLTFLLPKKLATYLVEPNVSLHLQLESIQSNDDQLSVSSSVELLETSRTSTGLVPETNILLDSFAALETIKNANVDLIDSVSSFPSLSLNNDSGNADRAGISEEESSTPTVDDGPEERLRVWVNDALINRIFENFRWDFQWMEERIPVQSPKLPQSTSSFLLTLCTDCYFLLHVSANGPPHVQASNSSIILKKSDEIVMTVVNPTRNANAIFVRFALTLSVRLTAVIERGVFRTQVDLLETDIRLQEGAFPTGWKSFLQDLVKGMIMDVIWPNLKKDIEALSYADGVQIPVYCGLKPHSARLHVDDNGRMGASATLHLENASLQQCIRQFKSKLPDPSRIFAVRERRKS